jgi:hypothetical protein
LIETKPSQVPPEFAGRLVVGCKQRFGAPDAGQRDRYGIVSIEACDVFDEIGLNRYIMPPRRDGKYGFTCIFIA